MNNNVGVVLAEMLTIVTSALQILHTKNCLFLIRCSINLLSLDYVFLSYIKKSECKQKYIILFEERFQPRCILIKLRNN